MASVEKCISHAQMSCTTTRKQEGDCLNDKLITCEKCIDTGNINSTPVTLKNYTQDSKDYDISTENTTAKLPESELNNAVEKVYIKDEIGYTPFAGNIANIKEEYDVNIVDSKFPVCETTINVQGIEAKDNDVIQTYEDYSVNIKMESLAAETYDDQINEEINVDNEMIVADDMLIDVNQLSKSIQCPYCNICLGQQEYLKYHMKYCRNNNKHSRELEKVKDIQLGELFESYEEFVVALNNYCNKEYVSFYKREARTILGAKKKTVRYINPKLKYYQLKYACIKGGKAFKSSGNEKRNTSTYKEGCNAHITLRATHCGNALQIISTETNHNHQISKQLYDHLSQQRRHPENMQSEIIHLAKLKPKRKRKKFYVEENCNKIILLKDIHNLTKKLNTEKTEMNLQNSIKKFQTKHGADCHVLSDEENNVKALIFQTKMMKHYMSVYPEFICIDTTFKLLDIRTPVLIIINEDGIGLSEIIAVGILVEENTSTMQWFFSKFKENNPKWTEIKSVMADKDLNERLLKENFPNTNVLICIFHVMKTFNREISTVKLGITLPQRQTALDILQKMVYSRDTTTYTALYEEFIKNCPHTVIEYFNKNWHDIKDEWTLGSKFLQANFLNNTNSRLESLIAKIKSLVKRYSTLSDFIDEFFKLIIVMNDERDNKAANLMYKVPICFYEKESTLHKYFTFLTSYAFEFVKNQFLNRDNSSNSKYKTTAESCNCESHTSILLPCLHILKTREDLAMDMYEESLCNGRWTRKHYYANQRLFILDNKSLDEQDRGLLHPLISNHTVEKSSVKLNQHEKFNKACMLLKSLASLISDESDASYHAKLRQLVQLKTAWENDKDVIIVEQNKEIQNNMNIDQANVSNSVITNNIDNSDNILNSEVEIFSLQMAEVSDSIPILENNHDMSKDCDPLNQDNILNVTNVISPSTIKKRGRPRGRNIIGMSTKRKKRTRSNHSSEK